jgi:ketosteroid isomerase-like protein
MKRKATAWIVTFLAVAAMFSGARSARAAEGDKQAVLTAAAQFYAALNQMFVGDLRQMKEVWSHADDVTYMGPGGGFQVGWDQVLKIWEAQAAMKLGGKVEPAEMRIAVGRDIAVVHNYEKGENTNPQGGVEKVSIRATNVFRKEGGKWRMIGHHTDLLPYLAKS